MPIGSGFSIRLATPADIPDARALMTQVVREDFRSEYDPAHHRDIDDIEGGYLTPPRHALFVAVDDASGAIVATGGVRGGWLRHGPAEIEGRYDDERTAQLVRIYVRREYRRRGIARAVVRRVLQFIIADSGYEMIALHTFPHSPGALVFWESMATKVAEYERDGQYPQVFFEISPEQVQAVLAEPSGRSS